MSYEAPSTVLHTQSHQLNYFNDEQEYSKMNNETVIYEKSEGIPRDVRPHVWNRTTFSHVAGLCDDG